MSKDPSSEYAKQAMKEILDQKEVDAAWKNFEAITTNQYRHFNPKINCLFWAASTFEAFQESYYSLYQMIRNRKILKDEHPKLPYPSNVSLHLSYYTDNCMVHLISFRDKLALTVRSLYRTFDYENDTPGYKTVLKNLIDRKKNSNFKTNGNDLWIDPIISALKLIDHDIDDTNNRWTKIKNIRRDIAHKLKPRIEIGEVKKFHYEKYLVEAKKGSKEFEQLIQDTKDRHKDQGKEYVDDMINAQKLDGKYYLDKGTRRLHSYQDLEDLCRLAIVDAAKSFTECLKYVGVEISQLENN